MAIFCRQHTKSTANERTFCQSLLNNDYPIWEYDNAVKIRKKGFHLPPDDFVYGLKHPQQNGITGVAAALQYYETSSDISKSMMTIMPDFITINKITAQLGLTKVRDIHQYRRTMNNNHQTKPNSSYCTSISKKSVQDIIHGRVTGEQPSMRDLIENKYLHEWLHKTAIRRCREILNDNFSNKKKITTSSNKIST